MADTGLTEVAATVEERVSNRVLEVLTSEMVVPGTISDYSAEVGPGMDLLKIPSFGNFTVQTKLENTALTPQDNAFSTDDLPLNKHEAVPFLVEDIAETQAKVAVTQAYIDQASRDMAAKMDANLITDMVANVSAAAPDNILDFSNSPTDTISKGDFLAARSALSSINVPMSDRFCMISPDREADILAIGEFVKVNESGSEDALRNGRIGKLFGFDVFVSSQADSDGTLFYHKTSQAFARQVSPRVEQERNVLKIATEWVISQLYGFKTLDSGKRSVSIKDGGA